MKRILIIILLLYGTGSELAALRLYVEPHREGDHDGLKLFIFVCLVLLGILLWHEYSQKWMKKDKSPAREKDSIDVTNCSEKI